MTLTAPQHQAVEYIVGMLRDSTLPDDVKWAKPKDKFEEGVALVLAGKLHATDTPGVYEAEGSKGARYRVSATECGCPDHEFRPSTPCKHRRGREVLERERTKHWTQDAPQDATPMAAEDWPEEEKNEPSAQEGAQEGAGFVTRTMSSLDTPQEQNALQTPTEVPESCHPAPSLSLHLPRRSITAIVADLSRPLPEACVAHRKETNTKTNTATEIAYLHWYDVRRVLDTYAPGWEGRVVHREELAGKIVLTYRLTIPCLEGAVVQEDVGFEEKTVTSYGDPFSNAFAMAFRRTAAKFGVGAWLYERDKTSAELARHLRQEKVSLFQELGGQVDACGLDRAQVLTWLRAHTGATRNDDVPVSALKALLAHLATLTPAA